MNAPLPVIAKRIIEEGLGFATKQAFVDIDSTGAEPAVNAWSGFAYGFMLTPTGSIASSPIVMMQVRGVGQKSNDVIPVVVGQFYECPFDKLDFVQDPMNLLSYSGTYLITVAIKPYARILPSGLPAAAYDYPAASGGNPQANIFEESQLLTRAIPTTASEGAVIGGASAYWVVFEAPVGQTITGGNVDLWRYLTYASRWVFCGTVALPTGQRAVALPADKFLARVGGDYLGTYQLVYDRFLAAASGVTLSGVGTTVVNYTVLQ